MLPGLTDRSLVIHAQYQRRTRTENSVECTQHSQGAHIFTAVKHLTQTFSPVFVHRNMDPHVLIGQIRRELLHLGDRNCFELQPTVNLRPDTATPTVALKYSRACSGGEIDVRRSLTQHKLDRHNALTPSQHHGRHDVFSEKLHRDDGASLAAKAQILRRADPGPHRPGRHRHRFVRKPCAAVEPH